MCFQDQSIEAKAKPVQELNCSDIGALWLGDDLMYYRKKLNII